MGLQRPPIRLLMHSLHRPGTVIPALLITQSMNLAKVLLVLLVVAIV